MTSQLGDLSYKVTLENGNSADVPRWSFMQMQRCYGLHLDYRRMEMAGNMAAANETKVVFLRFALGWEEPANDKKFDDLMGKTNLERQSNLTKLVSEICDHEMPELYLADGACYLNPRWEREKQNEVLEKFKTEHPKLWAKIQENNPALQDEKEEGEDGDDPPAGDTAKSTSSRKSPRT